MRRVAVLLMALFLVNLPFVNASIAAQRVERYGEQVSATVVETHRVGRGYYADLRFPEDVDASGQTFSVRVDRATYDVARRTRTLSARVVPGHPATFRAEGQVTSSLFAWVALGGDALFLLGAVIWWRRRQWRLFRVAEVGDDVVTLERDGLSVTATAPERWLLRTRPGQRVAGSLHLVADQDVLALGPTGGGPGLEQRSGASYVVRGAVCDVDAGRVVLDVADGLEVAVEPGPHRNRADLREVASASGTLHFTPHR